MTAESKKISRGRTPTGNPNPVDVHVGNRIKIRRNLMGFSQEKLAGLLGLTFQQVQKYEKGLNRVSASRLWDFSVVLNTPVAFFFEDMDKEVAKQSPRMFRTGDALELNEESEMFNDDPMTKKETLELVNAYYKIGSRQTAKRIFDLIMTVSKTQYVNDAEENENE
ncbi:MAG: helix-turn-helix domain-containing protein [Alphaproteobacteria bacterium]|nr:helix-turn-helix domain-containing protein [Alphaproteobacteria bacterium]